MIEINSTMSIIETYFDEYPLVFAFLTSLIGNSIPYATIPYLVFFLGYGALVNDPVILAGMSISGGIGAAVGKLIVYFIGRGVNKLLSEKSKQNLSLFARAFSKSIFVIVFLFAALPLPDDVIYLPLGVAGYSIAKFFLAVALGKIIITFLALILGSSISFFFSSSSSTSSSPIAMLAAVALGIIFTIIVAKIDWEKIVAKYQEKGWQGLLETLVGEISRLFSRKGETYKEKE